MKTIRLDNGTRIIFMLFLVMVVIIILLTWRSSKYNTPQEGKLTLLLKRWRELTIEIEEKVRTLKLNLEMRALLEKKISRLFELAKTIFVIVFLSVVAGFYWQTNEILSSIMNTVGLIVFICGTSSFFMVNRFAEHNSIIKFISLSIRRWVYKKYGYDPSEYRKLQLSLNEKKIKANLIQIKISQLNASHNLVNN